MPSTPDFIDASDAGEQGRVREILTRGPAVLIENGEAVAIMVSPEAYSHLITALKDLQTEFQVDARAAVSMWERLKPGRAQRMREVPGTVDNFLRTNVSDEERRVLELCFGLKDGRQRSYTEVARETGIARTSTFVIKNRTLNLLRGQRFAFLLRDLLPSVSAEMPFSADPNMDPCYAALLDAVFFPKSEDPAS
jgi:hypothetical protein